MSTAPMKMSLEIKVLVWFEFKIACTANIYIGSTWAGHFFV